MRGSQAKRGTKGLRKRCPWCKKLRRFHYKTGDVAELKSGWEKRGGCWVCPFCIEGQKVFYRLRLEMFRDLWASFAMMSHGKLVLTEEVIQVLNGLPIEALRDWERKRADELPVHH
jgi:hypothetical protein